MVNDTRGLHKEAADLRAKLANQTNANMGLKARLDTQMNINRQISDNLKATSADLKKLQTELAEGEGKAPTPEALTVAVVECKRSIQSLARKLGRLTDRLGDVGGVLAPVVDLLDPDAGNQPKSTHPGDDQSKETPTTGLEASSSSDPSSDPPLPGPEVTQVGRPSGNPSIIFGAGSWVPPSHEDRATPRVPYPYHDLPLSGPSLSLGGITDAPPAHLEPPKAPVPNAVPELEKKGEGEKKKETHKKKATTIKKRALIEEAEESNKVPYHGTRSWDKGSKKPPGGKSDKSSGV